MSSSSASPNPNASSSQFQDLFNAILEDYSQKTGKEITTDPITAKLRDCNSSGAVFNVLEEQFYSIDHFLRGDADQEVQLMRRLEPIIDILFGLSNVLVFREDIGFVRLTKFELRVSPMKAIFAGVGLLLVTAKQVSTSYDALIELFEIIDYFLSFLKVLTETPSSVEEFSVKIVVELFGVLALATQQILQRRLEKFAKKLLGGSDIEAVLQRLDQLTVEESRMIARPITEVIYGLFKNMNAVMDGGKVSIDNIQEALDTMQMTSDDLNIKRNRFRRYIQRWLSPPDPSMNHNLAREAHLDGTATWFLEEITYNEWKATGSLLWIQGNPGSGKSIFCSSIIRDITSMCPTGLASVAYYYFDFRDAGKQNRRGLLSSLLMQFCAQSDRGCDILSSLYEAHHNGSRYPSEDDLIQALKKVLELPCHGRVYIVIDAVDEIPNTLELPSPREDVLQLIKELVDLRHPDLRICITSRPEVDIRTVLGPLASHTVSLHDEGGQRNDIINYIRSFIWSDWHTRRWREEDRQLVFDFLSQKANGMFRWAFYQLEALLHTMPSSIRHVLNELPLTLDETYERMLLEIRKENREHAIRLLQCLAISRRPLRVNELAEVLAMKFDTTIPTLNESWRWQDSDMAVESTCSALVAIVWHGGYDDDDDDDYDSDYDDIRVVQFSHYSVKEFFTSDRLGTSEITAFSRYYISPESAHATLAQCCIGTLLQLENHIEDVSHNFPLAKYAAENWFHHARYNNVASHVQDGMECLIDPDRKYFSAWVSMHDIEHVSPDFPLSDPLIPLEPSPLYYAVLCGIGSLVEYLIIKRQQDPYRSRGSLGTPLHAAVVLGHGAIARILLEHTADVNVHDHYISSLLHVAVEGGDLDIIRSLLGYGADINVFDHRVGSPLQRALQYRKFDVVELLVNGGADVNVRDKYNSTPLHAALRSGDLDIAQSLLSYGADADALDHRGDSPLHQSSRNRNFSVVELLVKHGANLNVQGKYNSTPLHEASASGNFDVAQLLLNCGAHIDVFDPWGDTPLHKASRYQKLDVVELLVNGGADVNVRDKYNSTPLHVASRSGDFDIALLLLSYGADADALDHRGDSPLHQSSRNRNFSVMELLVKHGANLNVQGKYNSTPLHEASASGNFDVAQLLLNCGARINVFDPWGDTPLHKASRYQKFDVVELLVKGGADVNSRGMTNSTPLHEASRSRSLNIAKFLLGHGADVNGLDIWGDSPLHESFRSLIVEPPLKARLKDARDAYDGTLIPRTSSGGNSDPVQLLSGTDIMNDGNDGCPTPLHNAPQGEKYAMARLLLDHGAEVNARGWHHRTPLHLAVFEGSIDESRLLIERGADVLAQTDDDQTPSGIASARGHDKLAQFLLRHSVLVMCSRYARMAAVGAAAAAVATVVVSRLNRFH